MQQLDVSYRQAKEQFKVQKRLPALDRAPGREDVRSGTLARRHNILRVAAAP